MRPARFSNRIFCTITMNSVVRDDEPESRTSKESSGGKIAVTEQASYSYAPDKLSAIQAHDDEGIKQIEADGADDKQIHRRDLWRVIAQECLPALVWRPTVPCHMFGDARLRDLELELEQFAVSTWCSPNWFSMLICRISPCRSASICGRPPCDRDFQRQ